MHPHTRRLLQAYQELKRKHKFCAAELDSSKTEILNLLLRNLQNSELSLPAFINILLLLSKLDYDWHNSKAVQKLIATHLSRNLARADTYNFSLMVKALARMGFRVTIRPQHSLEQRLFASIVGSMPKRYDYSITQLQELQAAFATMGKSLQELPKKVAAKFTEATGITEVTKSPTPKLAPSEAESPKDPDQQVIPELDNIAKQDMAEVMQLCVAWQAAGLQFYSDADELCCLQIMVAAVYLVSAKGNISLAPRVMAYLDRVRLKSRDKSKEYSSPKPSPLPVTLS